MGTLQARLEERVKEPPKVAEVMGREYGTPPPFVRDESGAVIYQKYYDSETSEWCRNVHHASAQSQGEDPELQDIPKWIQVLSGNHWPQGRPSYRAKPVFNLSLRYWKELQSIISDIRLNTYVHSENENYKSIAQNITKLSASNWLDQDGDITMMESVQHASFGIGYTKVGMNTKEQHPAFLSLGSDQVIPILPSRNDFQQSAGVIYECWKPLSWFYDKFSILARAIKPEATGWHRSFASRPFYIPEYTWNNMNPGLRNVIASTIDSEKGASIIESGRIPMARAREFWFQDDRINQGKHPIRVGWGNFTYTVLPGHPVYPYGRLICTAGEECDIPIYDGPNFHWHGMYPYDPLRLQPVVWMFSGLSVLKDIYPLNSAINQLLADLQDYLKQILNPTLIVKPRTMTDEAWEEYFPGMPGAKIMLLSVSGGIAEAMKFERVDPTAVGIIPQAIQMLTRFFYEQAGMVDSGQLTNKKQIPSEGTIEQIQNIRQSIFRLMARHVEVHMKHIGKMQVSDILQFTNRKQAFAFLGNDGVTWQNMDWDPDSYVELKSAQNDPEPFRRGREFVKNFRQMVSTGTALPAQRQAMASMANTMNARNRMSTETLYKFLSDAGYPVPPWSEEKNRIIAEMAELPQPKPPRGGGGRQPAHG